MDIVHVNHPSKKPLGQNDYDDDNDEDDDHGNEKLILVN